ncbi:hypothetical protein CES86_4607 [Brucella lupini]|uniref:Uncharacterized protein n=1 Tax=Brucella lupini TaxID=255457 RepID=A0A256GB14_9HYPH|nr:hypothetical protein CES86_4607 [Brucella lupini]
MAGPFIVLFSGQYNLNFDLPVNLFQIYFAPRQSIQCPQGNEINREDRDETGYRHLQQLIAPLGG